MYLPVVGTVSLKKPPSKNACEHFVMSEATAKGVALSPIHMNDVPTRFYQISVSDAFWMYTLSTFAELARIALLSFE